MDQKCDKCGQSIEGLVKIAEPEYAYNHYKHWCFACVYEKGLLILAIVNRNREFIQLNQVL